MCIVFMGVVCRKGPDKKKEEELKEQILTNLRREAEQELLNAVDKEKVKSKAKRRREAKQKRRNQRKNQVRIKEI